jgi:UDP-N-acetylglucosamine 4,6-dehydratase (inverting)
MLNGKTILITGGTGSFGKMFTNHVFAHYEPKKVIIYSRDEYKQFVMKQDVAQHAEKMRFFIGDVREKERLMRAFDSVDYVVHAAALKQVPACEYNPFEAVKTNTYGAQNVCEAAIDRGVKRVVALSTDKAVNPINLYGATKLASDKLFVAANAYAGAHDTVFSIVRYGNVAGSRGSVIPYFKMLVDAGAHELPITDSRMTRFWITLDEAVDLVIKALVESKGGETYIAKIPSFRVADLARAMLPSGTQREIGIREGEKLHETMVTEYDSLHTYEYDKHFIIYPGSYEWWDERRMTSGGRKVQEFFRYSSDNNSDWLSIEEMKTRMASLRMVY